MLVGTTFTSVILISFGLLLQLNILNPTNKINLQDTQLVKAAEEIIFLCKQVEVTKKEECYRDEFMASTKKYGMVTASAILAKTQEKEPSLISCHRIGHYIGRASYERSSKDFWKVLNTINTNLCSMGMLHGFLEAYITDHPETEMDKNFIEYICKETQSNMTCPYLHLLGHMILVFNYGDFSTSMSICSELQETWLYNCYDGVFMEDFHKTTLSEHGLVSSLNINNEYALKLEKTCLSYTGTAEKACWRNMASIYYTVHGYNPDMILQKCSQSKNQEANTMCYQSAAAILSLALDTNNNLYAPEKILSLCTIYTHNDPRHKACIGDILSLHIYNSRNSLPRMRSICELEPPKVREWCFNSIENYLQKI